jgi:hypothetical protein
MVVGVHADRRALGLVWDRNIVPDCVCPGSRGCFPSGKVSTCVWNVLYIYVTRDFDWSVGVNATQLFFLALVVVCDLLQEFSAFLCRYVREHEDVFAPAARIACCFGFYFAVSYFNNHKAECVGFVVLFAVSWVAWARWRTPAAATPPFGQPALRRRERERLQRPLPHEEDQDMLPRDMQPPMDGHNLNVWEHLRHERRRRV